MTGHWDRRRDGFGFYTPQARNHVETLAIFEPLDMRSLGGRENVIKRITIWRVCVTQSGAALFRRELTFAIRHTDTEGHGVVLENGRIDKNLLLYVYVSNSAGKPS